MRLVLSVASGSYENVGKAKKAGESAQDRHVVPGGASSAHLLGVLALNIGANSSADDIDLDDEMLQ